MAVFTPWKLSSQKLGFFLVTFGFIWGMMLLHFTIQQRTQPESSSMLREQILDLSKRYIKALAEENRNVVDGPYAGVMTAYGKHLASGASPPRGLCLERAPEALRLGHRLSRLSLATAFMAINCTQRNTFRKLKHHPLGDADLSYTLTLSSRSSGAERHWIGCHCSWLLCPPPLPTPAPGHIAGLHDVIWEDDQRMKKNILITVP